MLPLGPFEADRGSHLVIVHHVDGKGKQGFWGLLLCAIVAQSGLKENVSRTEIIVMPSQAPCRKLHRSLSPVLRKYC